MKFLYSIFIVSTAAVAMDRPSSPETSSHLQLLTSDSKNTSVYIDSSRQSFRVFRKSSGIEKLVCVLNVENLHIEDNVPLLCMHDERELLAVGDDRGKILVYDLKKSTHVQYETHDDEPITSLQFQTSQNGLIKLISTSKTQEHVVINPGWLSH